MKKKNWNSLVIEILSVRAIAFNPLLAEIGGSATAGLFMSQMLYWWEKGHKAGWVYKTIWNFQNETRLNRSEQDRAIKVWEKLGVLRMEVRGVPPIRHFKVDVERLLILLKEPKQFSESSTAIRSNEQNTTESTTENTDQRLRTNSTMRGVEVV